MPNDLWVLQFKPTPEANWADITAPIPFDEVQQYVNGMLQVRRDRVRQCYYRAICVTNDEPDNVSWQALPDFPDFKKWVEVGKAAVMEDGTIWQKVH